jgi:hypothetical protein
MFRKSKIRALILLFFSTIACFTQSCNQENIITTEVLVIGEGTGATTAAIQSARSGAKTILVNPLPWLGGMLTSAGVSAVDGNHDLPAGLWGEFRDSLRKHYGSTEAISTGWVSHNLFEPHVGDYYWKQMAAKEPNLTILYSTDFIEIEQGNNWHVTILDGTAKKYISTKIVIDGTDLGDVAAKVGAAYALGMDARKSTGESMAPEKANDIIQDLTYAVILKDYGKGTDKTITRPSGYDARMFKCACQKNCDDPLAAPHPCATMLDYGKLPNSKYMINWPIKGNDYYANVVEQSDEARKIAYQAAKNKTLQFIYYIQTELGYKHLGLADDEFPTQDALPLMPYHREGRRIHGLVQLNVNHIVNPYDFNLYRTGIAVGDYPIDHHHKERADAPEINFPPVPSFSIPIGALLPKNVPYFIMADKAISVTNIVNGASRLQPVVIQIGQVAGLLAAMAIAENIAPSDVNIRNVQEKLLNANGYLLPFIDVKPSHPHFKHIQRVAAVGLLQGKGIPYKWSNQTWFYPDSLINERVFFENIRNYISDLDEITVENKVLTIGKASAILFQNYKYDSVIDNNLMTLDDFTKNIKDAWEKEWQLSDFDLNRFIKRVELAVFLDQTTSFWKQKINMQGDFTATAN